MSVVQHTRAWHPWAQTWFLRISDRRTPGTCGLKPPAWAQVSRVFLSPVNLDTWCRPKHQAFTWHLSSAGHALAPHTYSNVYWALLCGLDPTSGPLRFFIYTSKCTEAFHDLPYFYFINTCVKNICLILMFIT